MMINVLPGTGRTKRPKLSMEKAAGLKRVINQIFSRATADCKQSESEAGL